MAITSNCAEIIITNPQGSVAFNKLITTTELSPAKTVDSEDRVYLIQNSENAPQTFWWNLEKAIADGFADLEELYDYFVAEIASQCGGGGGGDGGVEVDGTTIIGDGVNTPLSAIFNQTGKYIINGGASWSGTGLVYDVSIINYYFNGVKATVATQKTLAVSDPTNNRFDAIVVNEIGTVSVITGTASSSPVFPIIPSDKILVQYILVTANTVVPVITQEQIHADNPTTNWTVSNYTISGGVVGSTNFAATTTPLPQKGSNYIKNNRDNQTGVQFIRNTTINLPVYTYMTVWVYLPIALNPSKKLNIRWQDASATPIGNILDLFSYGISRTNIGVWQMAYIPIYNFGSITNVQGIKFILDGEAIGSIREWDIDNISLSNGLVVGNPQVTPLSSLSPATSANVIDNGNKTQEWQWNSQTNAPMLKLSSTSTGAVTGGNGLEINLTGNLGVTNLTTYAAKFINTRSSTNGANSGAYFEGNNSYGLAIQTGRTAGGSFTGSDIAIGANGALRWNNGGFDGNFITSLGNSPQFFFNSVGTFNFRSTYVLGSIFSTVASRPEIVLGLKSATRSSISFGSDNAGSVAAQYRAESVTACIIERDLGKLLLSSNAGLAGGSASFTPTYQICVDGTNNNVAIGKGNTAGDASAKLEVVSTSQGFLPPRMTATLASAIASPAQGLMLFVTTTNGTFTSIGWWGYGTSWKLILAQ